MHSDQAQLRGVLWPSTRACWIQSLIVLQIKERWTVKQQVIFNIHSLYTLRNNDVNILAMIALLRHVLQLPICCLSTGRNFQS